MKVPSRASAGVGWYGVQGRVTSAIRNRCPKCGANPNTRCLRKEYSPDRSRYLAQVHKERKVAQLANV